MSEPRPTLELAPIGVARTPFTEKHSAPRQPAAARGVQGRIELFAECHYEHALSDLSGFSHVWVLFWFHLNSSWKAKVLPPRSAIKRGVFATRSPHRPNPIGLSVLRLRSIEGCVLHVEDVDLLDGTPVLDIKPYIAYTDVVADASNGWLADPAAVTGDPGKLYVVSWSERAREQLGWLLTHTPLPLQAMVEETLALGPTPHPYRRIKAEGDHLRLAVKDFRFRFVIEAQDVRVLEISSGYPKRVLNNPRAQATESTPLEVHRAFVARFAP